MARGSGMVRRRQPGRDWPLARLKNIGPVSAQHLAAAGIETEADLRALGAAAAYRRVKHREPRHASVVLLYALEGALGCLHWNALPAATKARLRREVGA